MKKKTTHHEAGRFPSFRVTLFSLQSNANTAAASSVPARGQQCANSMN